MSMTGGYILQTETSVITVAHVTQLAVATVFLLTSVGAILVCTCHTFGSHRGSHTATTGQSPGKADFGSISADKEIVSLISTARLIYWSISLSTICAFYSSITVYDKV